MPSKPTKWDLETEVLIVGSGGAGFMAALTAHDNGAKVTIIEKSDKVGGTTAVSAGVTWIPNNPHLMDIDVGQGSDSKEKAMTYLRLITSGRVSDVLLETFVNTGPEMIKYVEENTTLTFVWSGQPDYHPEHPGSMKAGRSLGQPTFNMNELGEFKDVLRKAPLCFLPMGWNEIEEKACLLFPANMDFELIARRMEEGLVGMGMSLTGHLFKAALDRDIRPILRVRASELIVEDGVVIGLRATKEGNDFYVRAHKGIILASGGFEWNEEMKTRFLPGTMVLPCSPPYNEGDGLKIAMTLGAQLRSMHGFIGTPVSIIPGEEYDGKQLHRMALGERSLPHTIMVNRFGKRFVNEYAWRVSAKLGSAGGHA